MYACRSYLCACLPVHACIYLNVSQTSILRCRLYAHHRVCLLVCPSAFTCAFLFFHQLPCAAVHLCLCDSLIFLLWSGLVWSVHGVCVSEALKRWSKCQIRQRPFVRKYGAKAEPFVRYAHVHTCHPQQHTMNTPHYAHSLTHYLLYVRACVRVIISDFVVVRRESPSHRSGINEHLFCP